jgi:hypothetical protein
MTFWMIWLTTALDAINMRCVAIVRDNGPLICPVAGLVVVAED